MRIRAIAAGAVIALSACGSGATSSEPTTVAPTTTPVTTAVTTPVTTVAPTTTIVAAMNREARLAVLNCQDAITGKANLFTSVVALEALESSTNGLPLKSATLTNAQDVCKDAATQIKADNPQQGSAEAKLYDAVRDIGNKLVFLHSFVTKPDANGLPDYTTQGLIDAQKGFTNFQYMTIDQ